jgi:TolB-like protein/class 3 adenylate cyclase/Flp pilus assembly protein TadD
MAQREITAIMFTDLVGYSALSERNEMLALEVLEKHWELLRSVFTKFDGHEIKTIGDAFLIEFSSALRAVEAGLAIQRTLEDYNRSIDEDRKIIIRIGIHLGDVERREDDVFGDGVNIASRIEPLAPSGGICISEQVYLSVRNKVDEPFHSMGEQKLKNISQPIVVYSTRPDQKATLIKTNFWQELRRRNVFKAGITYTIVAWLIIQIAAVTFPALNLPPWAITLVTVLIIIGFPIILLFAWAFELTPEGFKPTHHVDTDESITQITGRKFDFTIIGLLSVALFYVVLENYVLVEEESPVTTTTEAKSEVIAEAPAVADNKSIAVLPFANRSKSEDDAFFVDGIHDDILTQLAKIASLKVISRTSVMQYRDTQKTMKTIGDELGVATLLEGGIQRAGNRVRINMQLIDADTDKHLWAETYNKELTATNIFEIQEQVATAIAKALLATLSPEEQERIAAVPTENLVAYEAYLLGKQRMAKRTSEALAEAVDYFQEAIALDPAFALAYVGLSDVYQLQISYGGMPNEKMNALAETAINKALALDDRLGEAYASLGLLLQDRADYANAEVAYKKALALNPNYATTYHWHGVLLTTLGKDKEALALYQKALALDPLSPVINFNVAATHARLGRLDEAMTQVDKILEIDPTASHGYDGKVALYWYFYGRLDEAAPWLRKGLSLYPKSFWNVWLGDLYLALGDDKQAECLINQGMKLGPEGSSPNFMMSFLYIYRNESEQALPYARQALKNQPTDADMLALLRDHDLRAGSYDKARAHYEKAYPALLIEAEPTINGSNYRAAIDLAYVLQHTGEQERADLLLDRSLILIQGNLSRLGFGGYEIADVEVYAMRGEKRQALTTLRQAIDKKWRSRWWYYLEHGPNLESIRNEPEFQVMLSEIKADMAEQLVRVKGMEKAGDVCVNP